MILLNKKLLLTKDYRYLVVKLKTQFGIKKLINILQNCSVLSRIHCMVKKVKNVKNMLYFVVFIEKVKSSFNSMNPPENVIEVFAQQI